MLPLRKEIQDFARSCERLLSPGMTPGDEPPNDEERQLIGYYLEELSRLTTSVNTLSKS